MFCNISTKQNSPVLTGSLELQDLAFVFNQVQRLGKVKLL